MTAHSIRIDTKQITLRLEMPKLLGFRMWLTIQLLKVVGFVCPLTVTIDTSADDLHLPKHRTYQKQGGVLIPNQWSIGEGVFDPISRIDVLLDGVKQDKVVAYDVDAGAVRRYVADAAGKIQLNATRDEALRETVHGKVEIVLAHD